MAFKLPAHIHEKHIAAQAAEADARSTFANLDDADLAASAQLWMQHCNAPKRIEPGIPVYDSTFWHAIVPEMIRRLRERT
jgi:hypothetical protein